MTPVVGSDTENSGVPSDETTARELRTQVREAIDPTGEQFALLDAVDQVPRLPRWVSVLAKGLNATWSDLADHGVRYRALLEDMEESLRVLVPRGWAVFQMDTGEVRRAVAMVEEGRVDEADEVLADQWEDAGAWRTKRVCDRVDSLGVAEPGYNEMFRQRARLLRKAKDHHEAGRYEASVPLIHAQMEGIVMDVAEGRKFFTKGNQRANVVDPKQLVAVEASLAALQTAYGGNVARTQTEGSLSRHGVAHGRELAYDTRVNSAKNWSVLDALVEWALPLARQEADRLRAGRQAERAGRMDVDAEGRRLDDREFTETKVMLRVLQTSAMGWWRQRGQFRDDLIGGVYTTEDFVKRGLPAKHGTHGDVGADGEQVWYWRATVSGWVLGIGLSANDRGLLEWLYSAAEPPGAGPLDAPEAWGEVFDTPPDWR